MAKSANQNIVQIEDDLFNRLEKNGLPQVTVLFTQDQSFVERLLSLAQDKLQKLYPQLELSSLNGLDVDPATLHGELSTLPMFEPGRLLLLKHGDLVFKKVAENKTILGYFQRDLLNLPEHTFFILQLDDAKLPQVFSSFESWVQRKGIVYQPRKLREQEIAPYLKNRAATMGYEVDAKAMELLAEKSSYELQGALRALDRLFTYALHEKKITRADVEEVCDDLQGDLHFALLDAIARRNVAESLRLFHHHKMLDASFQLGAWSKLFSDAVRFHFLNQAGLGNITIHEQLKLNVQHRYVVEKNNERFRQLFIHYSLQEVRAVLQHLLRLDEEIKLTTAPGRQRSLLAVFLCSLAREASEALHSPDVLGEFALD